MKYKYIVMDTIKDGSYYPVVCPVAVECDNIYKKIQAWAGKYEIIAAMLCDTKKRAFEICEIWRADHQTQNNLDSMLIRG